MRIRRVKGAFSGKSSTDKGSSAKDELVVSAPIGTSRFAIELQLWVDGWIAPTLAILDPLNGGTRELVYRDLDTRHETAGHWRVSVNYVDPDAQKAEEERREVGSYKFRGHASAKMVRMKQAIQHIASYAPPGKVAPDHKGAILVTDGEVEGVDVPTPYGKITYVYSHPAGVVDEEFVRYLQLLIGQVNEEDWHGYEAGELCLEEADASDSSDGPAEVSLTFEAIANVYDATYGDIVHVNHQGHDFIWFEHEAAVDAAAKKMVAKPIAAHVEQTKYRISYHDAFGF